MITVRGGLAVTRRRMGAILIMVLWRTLTGVKVREPNANNPEREEERSGSECVVEGKGLEGDNSIDLESIFSPFHTGFWACRCTRVLCIFPRDRILVVRLVKPRRQSRLGRGGDFLTFS
jgi:hypothetical protein